MSSLEAQSSWLSGQIAHYRRKQLMSFLFTTHHPDNIYSSINFGILSNIVKELWPEVLNEPKAVAQTQIFAQGR